jgi:CRP/FNR family cyclic AMP-dependent transcriptional regulator
MKSEDVVLFIGYLASALVFATFFMRTPTRLRQVAIVSNVVFIVYGFVGDVLPVLTLHVLLLPLNVWRLLEIRETHKAILAALNGDIKADWLEPFAAAVELKPGEMLFARGEHGETMYFIVSGTLLLKETGIELRSGSLVGEIAIFSPQKARTQSVVASSHARLLAMSQDEILSLYRRYPDFGIYLLRLVASRLLENNSRLQELAATSSAG